VRPDMPLSGSLKPGQKRRARSGTPDLAGFGPAPCVAGDP